MKSFIIVLLSASLFQACSLFKEDKCNECPKWEAPKVRAER
jgi:hypothetical protein